MHHVVVFQSARDGTGTTTLATNVAVLLAIQGQRVGIIDADMSTGNLHDFFCVPAERLRYGFADYLNTTCSIQDIVYDITNAIPGSLPGKLFFVPAHTQKSRHLATLDIDVIAHGIWGIIQTFALDVVIIDSHALYSAKTLLSLLMIALADALIIVFELDKHDYQGASVLIDIAKKLGNPHLLLVANQVAPLVLQSDIQRKIETTFQCELAAIIPYEGMVVGFTCQNLFVIRHPAHPVTAQLRSLAGGFLSIIMPNTAISHSFLWYDYHTVFRSL